jgi:predicted nuclease of predicted toxin-antitoxin system
MRVLFDQGTPIALADFLKGHSVRTAKQEGWDALSNGDLLSVAEAAGFHVLVTTDNGVVFQQNLTTRKIAIVVLTRNRWRMVQRMIRKIEAAVNDAKPGSFTEVEIPVR